MPIKPENKKLYPKDWDAIRAEVLERARLPKKYGHSRCEFCSVPNYSVITRDMFKVWRVVIYCRNYPQAIRVAKWFTSKRGEKHTPICLTIAHLNHDPTDNRRCNLRALCQRCHNLLDAPHRTINAAKTREGKRDE